jgi:hypothetical protein
MIAKWPKAAPSEIVRSGNVVCSVHHGGSSSYFEALRYCSVSFLLDITARLEFKNLGIIHH